MPDEKDRLGEQLRDKEKAEEDRYFEEQSRKHLEKLRQARAASSARTAACPRCGAPLEAKPQRGGTVDGCPRGCGIWLDKGDLEEIAKREGGSWLSRLLVGSHG